MIELLIAGAAAIVTHIKVRGFVHGRLRFVDRAHRPIAPVIAGAAATAIAAPVVWSFRSWVPSRLWRLGLALRRALRADRGM